jgi:hypothetical protein
MKDEEIMYSVVIAFCNLTGLFPPQNMPSKSIHPQGDRKSLQRQQAILSQTFNALIFFSISVDLIPFLSQSRTNTSLVTMQKPNP